MMELTKIEVMEVERWHDQSFNPGINLVVSHGGDKYELDAQLGKERYSLLQDKGNESRFYLVAREPLLPGVGVAVFDLEHHLRTCENPIDPVQRDEEDTIWLQEWEVEDRLGRAWEHLTDAETVEMLLSRSRVA